MWVLVLPWTLSYLSQMIEGKLLFIWQGGLCGEKTEYKFLHAAQEWWLRTILKIKSTVFSHMNWSWVVDNFFHFFQLVCIFLLWYKWCGKKILNHDQHYRNLIWLRVWNELCGTRDLRFRPTQMLKKKQYLEI